jgi:hypothetical protein
VEAEKEGHVTLVLHLTINLNLALFMFGPFPKYVKQKNAFYLVKEGIKW